MKYQKPAIAVPYIGQVSSSQARLMALAFISINLFISITRYYVEVAPILGLIPFIVYAGSVGMMWTKGFDSCHDKILFSQLYMTLPLVVCLSLPLPSGFFIYIFCLVVFFFNALACHGEIIRQQKAVASWNAGIMAIMGGIALGAVIAVLLTKYVPDKSIPFLLSIVGVCLLRSPLAKMPVLRITPSHFSLNEVFDFLALPDDIKKAVKKEQRAIANQYPIFRDVSAWYARQRSWLMKIRKNQAKSLHFFSHSSHPETLLFLFGVVLLVLLGAGYQAITLLPGATAKAYVLALYSLLYVGSAVLICFRFSTHSLQYGVVMGAVLLSNIVLLRNIDPFVERITISGIELNVEILMLISAVILSFTVKSPVLMSIKSRYGHLRVIHNRVGDTLDLINDDIIHGTQWRDPARQAEPISYYVQNGPFGRLFSALADDPRSRNVAVIGLGVGTIAAYGRPGQTITFYEIDPAVEHIACRTEYFSYIKNSQAKVKVVIGDAREKLEQVPEKSIGILVCDAYSGDNVPKHLLTKEAFLMYLSKLEDRGIILVDITNASLRLMPALARVAEELKLEGFFYDYYPGSQSSPHIGSSYGKGLIPEKKPAIALLSDPVVVDWLEKIESFFSTVGLMPSYSGADKRCRWAVLARTKEDIAVVLDDARWSNLYVAADVPLWTDEEVGYNKAGF